MYDGVRRNNAEQPERFVAMTPYACIVGIRLNIALDAEGVTAAEVGGEALADVLTRHHGALTVAMVGLVADYLHVDPSEWMRP